jgi:hypothetical protein
MMAIQETIDAAVTLWGKDTSIGQIFAALSPQELPIEAVIGERTDTLVEIHPVPDRFAVVRLMLTPDELETLIDMGMIAIASSVNAEPARRDRRS